MANPKAKKTNELDEVQISAALKARPDFFSRHPDCLAAMDLPVDTGPAISLHQYQVRLLREDKARLSEQLGALVKNVKTNHKIHADLLTLSGEMIKLAQQGADLQTSLDALSKHFSLFAVKLIDREKQAKHFKQIKSVMAKQDSLCQDEPDTALLEALFGDDAPAVQSLAIVNVKQSKRCVAQLVLAADSKKRFQPGMGGEFLKLLAQLVAQLRSDT